ncbi:major capsid protein [Dipodfec virus UOA04_Rod_997]|nr:major capsid protein [Dipodfec virus UOA04_Rod_997]
MSREIFNFVQRPKLRRSKIDLSYQNAFTCKLGELIPCYWEEVIPTDRAVFSAAPFVRALPLSAPIMGQLDLRMYYFFVPFHIIWDDFEEFITGGRDGISTPVMPYLPPVSNSTYSRGRNLLLDYFKLANVSQGAGNTLVLSHPKVSALQILAYWKIYDDYFRDQNLSPSLFDDTQSVYIKTTSGEFMSLDTGVQGHQLARVATKAWDKDLFTSALPFAQRGASVAIPIADKFNLYYQPDSSDERYGVYAKADLFHPSDEMVDLSLHSSGFESSPVNPVGSITAALDRYGNTFNINDLREASAIQRFLEFNAIGGSRYKEQVAMHFGGRVADYRLNRPEFICGMKTPVLSSQVLQQSQTNGDSVLGTQGGNLVASGMVKPRRYAFEEHGLVIGLMSITPRSVYSQGVSRFALKDDKFDFFFPYFENLGEQEIYNAEIYAQGNTGDMNSFGYGPRYYEYKHRENEAHGDFVKSLSYWIPQRRFSSMPALNQDFISVDVEKERSLNNIFAVTDNTQDQFYCVVQNIAKFNRPMSKYSKFLLR